MVKVHINRAPLIEYIGLDMKPANVHLQLGKEIEHEILMTSEPWLRDYGYIGFPLVKYGY